MPKKEWSEQERKAFGERMKAARNKNEQTKSKQKVETPKAQGEVTLTQEQFQSLMSRLDKVENSKTENEASDSGFDKFGKPQGVIQRYSIDPSYYKNPLDRLYDLAELVRFSLKDNYELTWNVEQVVYETKYGTSMADPKFTIVLKRKVYDNSGELTTKRILVQTGVFFEDPIASIAEAVKLGLSIDNANSSEFLEQMRFLRYKQWLVDIFNPQLPSTTNKRITEEVIDGKVYQIEDYSEVVA